MNLETMRLLVAKGLTAADLLEVAESMAVRVDKTAAERQARHRAKKAAEAEAVTRDITRDSNGVTQAPLSRPPNENNSNPPTHTPEKQTPARKGHRLPVDWQPAPLTGDVAEAVAAWPDGAIARELARFRDWARAATGPNARKSDWQAAWRNWLRRKIDEGTNQNGRNSQPPRPAIMDIGRSVAADLEREAAARAGY